MREPTPPIDASAACMVCSTGPSDEVLRAALARFPCVKLAIVYGSVADGRARPDSDLDLAVQADHALSVGERSELVEALAGVAQRPIDLVDLSVAGEPTLGQIVRHGRRVLGSPAAHGALIYRHLVGQADFVPLRDRIIDERRAAWIRT